MEHLNDLAESERLALLRYPVYICLLASTSQGGMDEKEKKVALKLSHIKTFASPPLLSPFYKEAASNFEGDLEKLNSSLPKERSARTNAILSQLIKLDAILKKLEPSYAEALKKSMRIYKDQVNRAHQNVLEFFIFPMPIQGITD